MSATALARGGALGLATLVVERGLALAGLVVLGRTLSPETFGGYAFAVYYLGVFQVLADLGLEWILAARLSRDPAGRARLLAAGLGLRLALASASAAAAVLLVPFAAGDLAEPRLVVGCAAAGLLLSAQPGFRALLRAEQRMAAVFAVSCSGALLVLAAVLGIARGGGSLASIFAAGAVANAVGMALAALVAQRGAAGLARPAVDLALWRDLLREAWPIGANLLVVTLGLRAGGVLLMRARGAAEVGYYGSASRLAESMNLLADGAMLAVFPVFARLAVDRGDDLVALARAAARALAVAMLLAVVVVSPLAPEILARLFRPEFAAAAPALVLMTWSALLAALGTVWGNLLVALGRQRVLFALNCAGATVLVALQAIVVPRFGGVGAAGAALAASAASHLVLAALPSTRRWILPGLRAAAGPAACAAAVLAATGALPLSPAARALSALAAFPLLLVVTGQSGRAEIAELRDRLAGPPPPAAGPGGGTN